MNATSTRFRKLNGFGFQSIESAIQYLKRTDRLLPQNGGKGMSAEVLGMRKNAQLVLTRVPSAETVDASAEAGADPDCLCHNWEAGCNGVTGGSVRGFLDFCDNCRE